MKTINTDKSLRRYQIAGFLAVLIASGGIGTWSAMASIHGAVIAPAVIMVESYSKRIQHKEGGIVREIKVRDGDRVEQGQELVVLDDTETRSELGIINALLREFLSKRARLDAQRDGAAEIVWPEEVTAKADDPEVARVMAGQKKLFETRRAALLGKKHQLKAADRPASRADSRACLAAAIAGNPDPSHRRRAHQPPETPQGWARADQPCPRHGARTSAP